MQRIGAQFAIWTENLSRAFRSGRALDGLSLQVPAGEVLALLGPNGAGKTTTVRILNGLLRPDRGRAAVLGIDPSRHGDDVRARTGVLTENAGLDDRLTALENLEVTARIRGFGRSEAQRRGMNLLERFGMAGRARDRTRGFSTGERKRVALARALLGEPEVLFLDEPTSGLDPAGTRDVVELIANLAGEGRTILLATHFLGEAGRLATRAAFLANGHLLASGRPPELADELFPQVRVEMDLGGPAGPAAITALGETLEAVPTPEGLSVTLPSRELIPQMVRTLNDAGADIYELRVARPSLEDVYFAVTARVGEISDGFLATAERTG